MTFAVWKFTLTMADRIVVPMPAGAIVLSVQMQNGKPCIWALVNPNARSVKRQLRMAGTGHPITRDDFERMEFVGTFQVYGGELIFHLFDLGESE